MKLELILIKRGMTASGAVETMYSTNLGIDYTNNLKSLANLFKDVLINYFGFIPAHKTSAERVQPYRIEVLYDTKKQCYLFYLLENKKCITQLHESLSIELQ